MTKVKKVKKDIISNDEFTRINNPPKGKHRVPVKNEIIHDDENKDAFEETLIGMEYDVDTGEDEWPEDDEEANRPNA